MAHPYHHAVSSVRKYGGTVEDYLPVHEWFDETKSLLADFRHRALRHHAQGIFECERVFGPTITNSTGRVVPVRWIAEQHVTEDQGVIPEAADWLRTIRPEPWMMRGSPIGMEEDEGDIPYKRRRTLDSTCDICGRGAEALTQRCDLCSQRVAAGTLREELIDGEVRWVRWSRQWIREGVVG